MILFIGLNPSNKSPDNTPFHQDTHSGRVLRGWIKEAGVDYYMMMNLYDEKTENNKVPSAEQLEKSITSVLQVKTRTLAGVVAIGSVVHNFLKKHDIPHLTIPHPSGLNRKLNNKTYIAEIINTLKEYKNTALKDNLL